eukprot:7033597-Pyramimonas_sp.AAC.1
MAADHQDDGCQRQSRGSSFRMRGVGGGFPQKPDANADFVLGLFGKVKYAAVNTLLPRDQGSTW